MGFFKKDSLQIITFQSYGTGTRLYIRGRALEDEKISLKRRNIVCLLINSWKRFETDEIRNTSLTIKLPNNYKINTITDNHGYFIVDEKIDNLDKLTNSEDWLTYEISYSNATVNRTINNRNKFYGEVLIPTKNTEFGVISDIDDTILHTGVASTLKWRLIINTFFKSPFKRKALNGASKFYSLLHIGKSGKSANPIFYVSHSPWNMYRYLEFFLKENNFPKGPILLRSFNQILKKNKSEKVVKHQEIINIINTYSTMKFILIGDAGEFDTDIYIEISNNYPDRILAIYIRSVQHRKKIARIKKLTSTFKQIPFMLVNSSEDAIIHAKKNGYIKKVIN